MIDLERLLEPTRSPSDCPSRFALVGYLNGTIDAEAGARIGSRVEQCPHCQAVLRAMQQERGDFVRLIPFERFEADLRARWNTVCDSDPAPSAGENGDLSPDWVAIPPWFRLGTFFERGLRWFSQFLEPMRAPIFAGLAAVVLVVASYGIKRPDESSDYLGLRGYHPEAPSLHVYRLRDSDVTLAQSGDIFFAADRLQFQIETPRKSFVWLGSVDDQGVVSAYYPDATGPSLPLESSDRVMLPGSILLDNFVGLERIFVVFSREPITGVEIERAVDKLTEKFSVPLPLRSLLELPLSQGEAEGRSPDDIEQLSFLLEKQ